MGSHPPARKSSQAFFWQGLLILLPLIVLTIAGIWSLHGQREAIEQKAREEARQVANLWAQGLEVFVRDELLSAHLPVPLVEKDEPFPFLYPLNPLPPSDLQPSREFLAAEGEPEELLTILEKYPDALAASGVPLRPIILFQQFQAAADADKPQISAELTESLITTHPSVLSEPILKQLGDQTGLERWHEHEEIRDLLRKRIDGIRENLQPGPGWITGRTGKIYRIAIIDDPDSREKIVQAAALDNFPNFSADAGSGASALEDNLSLSLYYDSLQIGPTVMQPTTLRGRKTHPALSPFASVTDGLATACIYIRDPKKLYAQYNRQIRWFIGIIAASAITALFGLWVTRRAYLKQQAVNRMKSNFVSSVSHELRAPIASIRLMAERLRAGKVDEKAKRSEYFGFIEQESRRLATLVENVLDFSRIEDGKKTYRFEETDIEQLATDTVQLMQPHAGEKKVTIETDFHPPENAPSIDPLEIQQALINLIDNAIKYSPEGETITVGLANRSAEHFQLWVQDHGPGIAKDEQQKIFQRFYRVGSELERETQGVGIGLAIVRHTAEAHGGKITLDSAPGDGCRFTLELPIKQP